ncbi:hypothetical protein L6R53_29095 [Myxococcota bacterium]|nr:hypothetical protein [Myxococcota bacterium]
MQLAQALVLPQHVGRHALLAVLALQVEGVQLRLAEGPLLLQAELLLGLAGLQAPGPLAQGDELALQDLAPLHQLQRLGLQPVDDLAQALDLPLRRQEVRQQAGVELLLGAGAPLDVLVQLPRVRPLGVHQLLALPLQPPDLCPELLELGGGLGQVLLQPLHRVPGLVSALVEVVEPLQQQQGLLHGTSVGGRG